MRRPVARQKASGCEQAAEKRHDDAGVFTCDRQPEQLHGAPPVTAMSLNHSTRLWLRLS
jgi:hypothetical protein